VAIRLFIRLSVWRWQVS